MKKYYGLLLIGLTMVLLSGCFVAFMGREARDNEMDPPEADSIALAFGYVDMTDADTYMEWANFYQTTPKVFDPNLEFRVFEEVFYLENLTKGTFRWKTIGGNGFGHVSGAYIGTKPVYHELKDLKKPITFRIKKRGIHYWGAYKYIPVDGTDGKDDTFVLKPIPGPSQTEQINKILDFAEGTKWEARLKAYLKKLKGK